MYRKDVFAREIFQGKVIESFLEDGIKQIAAAVRHGKQHNQ